jgi:putative holliday junction resolvase
MAFDFGERFVGVAIGEAALGSAHPLTMIDATDTDARFAAIRALIDEWTPSALVVGVPLSLDGTEHAMTERAQRFARQLEGRFRLPIRLVDERLTSVEAESLLAASGRRVHMGKRGKKTKDDLHALAAQLILQSYFDDHTSRR